MSVFIAAGMANTAIPTVIPRGGRGSPITEVSQPDRSRARWLLAPVGHAQGTAAPGASLEAGNGAVEGLELRSLRSAQRAVVGFAPVLTVGPIVPKRFVHLEGAYLRSIFVMPI
jgi:hypothetical protein